MLSLGTVVTYHISRVRKRSTFLGDPRIFKTWRECRHGTRYGIITGIRTFMDGYISMPDRVWIPDKEQAWPLYVVTYDMRRKPDYVLIEDAKVAEESDIHCNQCIFLSRKDPRFCLMFNTALNYYDGTLRCYQCCTVTDKENDDNDQQTQTQTHNQEPH